MKQNSQNFEQDLTFVANKVSSALNIFNETVVANNKLVTMYGQDEFLALIVVPYENSNMGQLRLRTKDMAAAWNNVPAGFSKINESKGLLADMKQAARVSLKRNSIWYIDQQVKDVIGERISFAEIRTVKGFTYRIKFTNGHEMYLSIVKDDNEYKKPHESAKLYFLANKKKEPISPLMTADECILLLIDVAMQTDKRLAKFIDIAKQVGGSPSTPMSYRTNSESYDAVQVSFNNGYVLKLRIENDVILVDAFGKENDNIYFIETRKFDDINVVYSSIREFSELPIFST